HQQVAAFEVHGEPSADRGVTEGGGQEGLADSDGSHDHGVVAALDETQRAQFVPDGAVVGDLGGVVPAVQGHLRIESRGACSAIGAVTTCSGVPPTAKCCGSRANRPVITVPGSAGCSSTCSVPASSMRAILCTFTTSNSSARA